MRRKQKIAELFRYYRGYFPFTLNAFIFAAAVWLSWKGLYTSPVEDNDRISSLQPFLRLMGKVIFWFTIALFTISILSTFAAWFYYLWLRSQKKTRLQLDFSAKEKKGKTIPAYYLQASLRGVFRPLLGFIRGRLFYDDGKHTEIFSLLANQRENGKLLRTAVTGRNRLILPDIKEYEIKSGQLYFEDMFRILSLAASEPIHAHFYQPPAFLPQQEEEIAPHVAEQTDIRTDTLHKVSGEYLNYKDFESGDDVRRIVWKLYAKNRELMVRIPERMEPFASHLLLYASFYAPGKNPQNNYMREMLNYYKNRVWTIYTTLSGKEVLVRLVPDQAFHFPEQQPDAEATARIISNADWQDHTAASVYFEPRRGSVFCFSSFTDPVDLKNILEQATGQTIFYFIQCSRVFHHFIAWHWLRTLFLRPERSRRSRLRKKWTFLPLRMQVLRQEKKIIQLLKQYDIPYQIL